MRKDIQILIDNMAEGIELTVYGHELLFTITTEVAYKWVKAVFEEDNWFSLLEDVKRTSIKYGYTGANTKCLQQDVPKFLRG